MKSITGIAILVALNMICYSQNYDESKVPKYVLPDVLTTTAKVKITSASSWEKYRRPEILRLFEDNVYGQMPKKFDSLKYLVTHEDKFAMNGRAHLKEVQVMIWNGGKSVTINLNLFTPNSRKSPSPVFLLINNRGVENIDPLRKTISEFWPAELVIDSGYAIAAFFVKDASPDNKEHYQEGVLQLYPGQLTAGNGMKAIGAWSWAASRMMDYFEKDKDIDARRVFVVGHSRGGKTALWTGAQDKRFAMVFANCSGNTGAALARRQYGETIKKINTSFPYWFCNNYQQYNDNVDALPVDQHMLIALIAPRPLYTTNASKDLWADPLGSFLSLKNAEKVYALYNKKSALGSAPPAVGNAIINSQLGYHIRDGVHNLMIFDWNNFIRFANYHGFGK
jgi:hypothetical protein